MSGVMKFTSCLATLVLTSLILCVPAGAEVTWIPVPGTKTPDESGRIIDYWYVGRNTITRRGNTINFDVNAYRVYARYSANCKTRKMSRIIMGGVNKSGQIIAAEPFREPFFQANQIQGKVLNYACSFLNGVDNRYKEKIQQHTPDIQSFFH
jgi:hypothetical protein